MQQINLYLPEFRPKREYFSLQNSILGLIVICISITFMCVQKTTKLNNLTTTVTLLEQENKGLSGKVASLKKTSSGESRTRLEVKVKRVRRAINNRGQIAKIMNGQSLGNRNGFSAYMDALSKNAVGGLFLQQFTLTQGGVYAQLKGVSKKPESVPLYISKLQKNSVFSNSKFGYLSIGRLGGHVEFSLSGDGPYLSDLGKGGRK